MDEIQNPSPPPSPPSGRGGRVRGGYWNLRFGDYLGFGIWNLEFNVWHWSLLSAFALLCQGLFDGLSNKGDFLIKDGSHIQEQFFFADPGNDGRVPFS